MAESFLPVSLDGCPVLYTGYPRGGCVAQLQTDLTLPPATAPAVALTWPGAKSCNYPDQAVDFHRDRIGGSTLSQSTWFSMLDQTQAPYQTPVIDNRDCPDLGTTCP